MASLKMAALARPFKASFEWYNACCKSHPVITMSITTGLTMAFGSYACQKIQMRGQDPKPKLDYMQIFNYTLFGALYTGPILKYWWYWLDQKIFVNKQAFLRPVKMMALDIVTCRFLIIAAFVYYVSLTQGKPIVECNEDFVDKIYPVYYESLKVWPLATLINFYLVPLPLRVLFANAVALGWNTYMAYLVSLPTHHEHHHE